MANKLYDDYIDDVPELTTFAVDEADAAFWDEFHLLESATEGEEESYTVTIENEQTGERRIYKQVRLTKDALKLE